MKDIRKILRSFRYAFKGLRHAYMTDKSFRLEIHYGLPIYMLLGWLLAPLASWEFLFFAFSYLLILLVELINTAFEKMLDRLHPEQHELIGRSKDIASAAVLLAFVFAALVLAVLVISRMTAGIGGVVIEHPFV